ncbi:MAG: 6-phosphofructokinase [Gallintestinimicrobium sp.]
MRQSVRLFGKRFATASKAIKGYQGLLNEEIIDMDARSVSDTIQKGGTILGTARCLNLRLKPDRKRARRSAADRHRRSGCYWRRRLLQRCAGDVQTWDQYDRSVGQIDLDIACTEYTIGFDTAVNTAMQAIDKVRDTSSSHERCSIIEVMGRNAGYIALWCGVGTGARISFFLKGTTMTSSS